MLQKWSSNFHSSRQNTLLSLINNLLRFVTTDNGRKNRPKIFLYWKVCLFFNLCFQQPLRCYRNDLVSSIVFVRTPCWASQIVSWGLSHSKMGEKIGQKLFSLEIMHFFFESLCFQQPRRCYRNDLVTSTVIVKISCGFL